MKIQFINIKTGKTFSVPEETVQPNMCTLWFDGGQSTNLIYYKQICFLSDTQTLTISLPKNNGIFNLVSLPSSSTGQTEFYGIKYYNYSELVSEQNQIESTGSSYNNYYLHNIFITAESDNIGQYLESITISSSSESKSYLIGADFYDEDEILLINLANQGQEIPQSIQRAIYDKNVHEELNDNILLNRKWKELLLNSLSTFVNKGSYKSLVNCLKWFEYGDKLKLEDYWKFLIAGKQFLNAEDIEKLLTTKYQTIFTGLAKTTYIGISCPLEEFVRDVSGDISKDDEKNPELENIVFKWTVEDMSLKMSLLGNFYSTYFAPIHLDLIHSTIEDIVYSPNFKIQKLGLSCRDDIVNRLHGFDCNIKNGQTFDITNISTQVGPDTFFNKKYDGEGSYEDIYTIGVDEVYSGPLSDDSDDSDDSGAKMFYSQLVNLPGVLIPIECHLTSPESNAIFEETIAFTNNLGKNVIYNDNKIVSFVYNESAKLYEASIKFNLIYFKPNDKYEVNLQFRSISGHLYTKRIWFSVVDTSSINLKIYKLVEKEGDVDLKDFEFSTLRSNAKEITAASDKLLVQYLPNYKDHIALNHFLVFANDVSSNQYLSKHYICFVKKSILLDEDIDIEAGITEPRYNYYTICVSKKLNFTPDKTRYSNYIILRDENIFMPQFYELEEYCVDENSLSKSIVSNLDLYCIKPFWIFGDGSELELKYTLPEDSSDDEYGWTFINKSKNNSFQLPQIQNPLMANTQKYLLDPGLYNIKFCCNISGEKKIIERKNAFVMRNSLLT